MDLKLFAVVFGTVLLAELGDKTQLAAMLFASKSQAGLLTVFLAASLALVLATGIAVVAGSMLARVAEPQHIAIAAGIGFVAIGIWTIASAL